jgi:kumamolisin
MAEQTTVSVILKRGVDLPETVESTIPRDQYAAHTADPNKFNQVVETARNKGLAIGEQDASRRTVRVNGTIDQIRSLADAHHEDIEVILGLDHRRVAKPHIRRAGSVAVTAFDPQLPKDIAKRYNFPTNDGSGQCVAIIELGGGYAGNDVTTVLVDGAQNVPGQDPNGSDAEVALDIAVVRSVAPGAKVVVYYAPNSNAGFYDAISTALHDTVNKPNVISISWGGSENSWTGREMHAYDNLFKSCAALGVTVCCASGDNGATDGDAGLNVDFPASSPNVLGCGGTKLGNPESVWNDMAAGGGATGGGFSRIFTRPKYQDGAHLHAMRGVPDVAGDACPDTGYIVSVDTRQEVIGGTSAVAPLWAALVALIQQEKGPQGFLNLKLYPTKMRVAFTDILQGDNGFMKATPHWDACTGLGTPKGQELLNAL